MAKFNSKKRAVKTAAKPTGPLATKVGKKSGKPKATPTFNQGPGFKREAKSDLFLMASASLTVTDDSYYESGDERNARFCKLVRKVAVEDTAWIAEFLKWLRGPGNIRTAAIVGAVEAMQALIAAKVPGARAIIASVLQRADEPGEMISYWSENYGEQVARAGKGGRQPAPKLPMPLKRGVADALPFLYTEYSALKYDTDSHAMRFADVLDLVHPVVNAAMAERVLAGKPHTQTEVDEWVFHQDALHQWIIDRRFGNAPLTLTALPMVWANDKLREDAKADLSVLLDPDALKAAGMTHEDTLSLAGSNLDKAKIWSALIPSLPYMAGLRNLRNIDQAKVTDAACKPLMERLSDARQVERSRQFPFRYFSAFKMLEAERSIRWGHTLDLALDLSLKNVPSMGGKTLVLIDTSGSMLYPLSKESTVSRTEVAAVFGLALALKGDADVYGWADGAFQFLPKGTSLLKNLDAFMRLNGTVGHGTNLGYAMRATIPLGNYARVVVISDMQTTTYADTSLLKGIPGYFFNLGGYAPAAVSTLTPGIYELGGLTDATFRLIPMLEAGSNGAWPWEM